MGQVVERFAPSPTGRLHLGHAFSAMLAHGAARAGHGRFLLRMEDIDPGRVRTEYAAAILDDLAWLGLRWDAPPLCQSARLGAYAAALAQLDGMGLLYPCVCTRREIAAALSAPQEGVAAEVYPGLCRGRDSAEIRASGRPVALRLDLCRAFDRLGGRRAVKALTFNEIGAGPQGETGRIPLDPDALAAGLGDVALGRKDAPASYHLAVVVDDAFQGVSCVTRGEDLFEATGLHRLLQALLDLPTPVYRHHRLIRDAEGRRLAKRDDARALATLRAEGATAEDVRQMVGLA